jgi:ATP-dependent helicase/nuclease subunit A
MGDRVVKYEASAGSGKTFRLTLAFLARLCQIFARFRQQSSEQRDIQKLLSSVLAITFTNKAAGEMKERILERLKRFALSRQGHPLDEGDREFLRELSLESGLPAGNILELSGFILEIIMAHYNDFNVKTIDSLMSAVVKVISPDLGLPPDFEIQVDASAHLQQKAYQYLEELCDRDWPEVEEFLKDIGGIEPLENFRVEEEIMGLLVYIHRLSMNQEVEEVDGEALLKLKAATAAAANDFKNKLAELLALIKAEPLDKHKNAFLKGNMVNPYLVKALEAFSGSEKLLGDLSAVVSRAFFKRDDPQALFKKDCPPDYRQQFTAAFTRARRALSRLVRLFAEFRLVNLNRFYRGFSDFRQRERQKIFVEEFSRTIRGQLREWQQSALPYIYLKLSERFRHFLFDEFQDTSELQFRALCPLIDETLSSDEQASLFIVGDRKQAIYRWRGGNSELMNEEVLRAEIPAIDFTSPGPFTRSLDANWRSAREIVDFNNGFWAEAQLAAALEAGGMAIGISRDFGRSFQQLPAGVSPQKGYVRIEVKALGDSQEAEGDGAEEELFGQILAMVREAEEKGYRGADIAILVRKNAEARAIIRFLAEQGVAAISDESLFLSSSALINQLIAFLKFLDFPPDNLSFYTFISGEVFRRAAVQKLPTEWSGFDETDFIGSDRGAPFYKIFQQRCPGNWQALIEPFFKSVGFLAVYDLYEDILQAFGLYENFPEEAMFLLSFGELLHQLEQRGISSIAALIQEWEAIKGTEGESQFALDMPEEVDRIRVMTLHKAKGLEFPVVILPLRDSRSPHERPVFLEGGHIFQISKDYAALNRQLAEIYLEEVRKAAVDILNLYYVGFTRARTVLLIPLVLRKMGGDAEARGTDPFKRLKNFTPVLLNHPLLDWPPGGAEGTYVREFGTFESTMSGRPAAPAGATLSLVSKRVLTAHWQREFLVFSGSPIVESSQEEARLRGERFHQVLAHIKTFGHKSEIRPVLETIVNRLGLAGEYTDWIDSFLTDDRVFPFFQGDFRVDNEVEVCRVGRERGDYEFRRIDRLMVTDDEVVVIDYKTGVDRSEAHERQVREYLEILRPLLGERRYRAFLLYPDLPAVEEVR